MMISLKTSSRGVVVFLFDYVIRTSALEITSGEDDDKEPGWIARARAFTHRKRSTWPGTSLIKFTSVNEGILNTNVLFTFFFGKNQWGIFFFLKSNQP